LSFIENCRRVIGFDSSSAHGNRTTAEFVANLCRDAGLFVEFQSETQGGIEQCNVIARPQKETPEQEILFQAHLDTVEPGNFTQWTKTQANPFMASIYDDVIYGLGSADVKLDFLCKLEALKTFAGRKMKIPFVLAGTYGAQSGMTGAIKLIRRKKLNAIKAFIGEPTDMRLAIAGKGLAVVDIIVPFSEEERDYRTNHDLQESSTTQSRMFAGKAAHSSNPLAGENAIMKMLEYLSQLPDGVAIMDLDGGINHNSVPASAILEIDTVAGFKDPILPKIGRIRTALLELESKLHAHRDDKFIPPNPTMNVGMIRAFDGVVQIVGSCRLPPTVSDEIYQGWMKSLNDICSQVGATFRVREYRKGFETDIAGSFVKDAQLILADMGLKTEPTKMTMSTEASVFTRLGVECLVWGPGQSVGNSHAPNEHVKISDLKQAIEFYKKAVERFCL
jgi:acetylornithine deacetylase/succinyl-diaminopimelate desuccinylase-like protein